MKFGSETGFEAFGLHAGPITVQYSGDICAAGFTISAVIKILRCDWPALESTIFGCPACGSVLQYISSARYIPLSKHRFAPRTSRQDSNGSQGREEARQEGGQDRQDRRQEEEQGQGRVLQDLHLQGPEAGEAAFCSLVHGSFCLLANKPLVKILGVLTSGDNTSLRNLICAVIRIFRLCRMNLVLICPRPYTNVKIFCQSTHRMEPHR